MKLYVNLYDISTITYYVNDKKKYIKILMNLENTKKQLYMHEKFSWTNKQKYPEKEFFYKYSPNKQK